MIDLAADLEMLDSTGQCRVNRIFREAFLSSKNSHTASGVPLQLAGISLPRRRFAHDAAAIARASLPAVVVRHGYRAFIFSSLEARRLDMPVAVDLLFVAAHFAHMGLSSSYARSTQRYEVDGADAAKAFLENEGVRPMLTAAVWDAISLHTTPGVTEHMHGITRLLAYGVRADLFGDGIERFSNPVRLEILDAFPRGDGFASAYLEAVGHGIMHRPETTFGAVSADVLERYSPTFYRANFCGRVLGSRWETG